MSKNNKKFWQRAAKFYSFFTKRSKRYQENFHLLSQALFPYLNEEMKALEIGCGTGQLSFLIDKKVGQLIATDFSEEMIKICEEKNSGTIRFQVEDGSNLSFPNRAFDAVIISNVLHVIPNAQAVLEEVKRVLKKDGIIFAPIYVNESKKFNFSWWFVEKIGLRTYQNKTKKEYLQFLEAAGLEIIFTKTVKAYPAEEFIVIAKEK